MSERETVRRVSFDSLAMTYRIEEMGSPDDVAESGDSLVSLPVSLAEKFDRAQRQWDEMQDYLWDAHDGATRDIGKGG